MNDGIRQSGQTLPLGLIMTALGLIALVGLYNVGQVALARSRLTHATDAAAYSGAIVQARSLNLLAHVQRTQVAHQVALAHLVTLGAWASFGHTEGRRFKQGNPPGVAIAALFGPSHALAYGHASTMLSNHRMALSRAVRGHDDAVHGLLAQHAKDLIDQLPALRDATIAQVLSENLPALKVARSDTATSSDVTFSVGDDGWATALSRHAGRAGGEGTVDVNALRGMVESSAARYAFLDPRTYTASNTWPVSHRCPWLRHSLRRRGSTWLDAQGRWRAVDTQSFHKLRSNKWIGCYFREYAMGWGGAQAKGSDSGASRPRPPEDFSKEAFWKWVQRQTDWDLLSTRDNPLASAYGRRTPWRPALHGLPASYLWSARDMHTGFTLQVRQRRASIATFDGAIRMAAAQGRFAFDGFARSGLIQASAAAQTYFLRTAGPHRSHAGGSHVSTFRPYWRARLTPLLRADQGTKGLHVRAVSSVPRKQTTRAEGAGGLP